MKVKITQFSSPASWYKDRIGQIFEVTVDDDQYYILDDGVSLIKRCDCIVLNDDPLDIQIGGTHYKDFAIQPVEYTMANNLNFLQGCIIERITRYNQEGGKGIQDLEKIQHECSLLISFIRGIELTRDKVSSKV